MGTHRTLRPELEQALVDRLLAAFKANGWETMHISDSRMVVNRGGRFEMVADPNCAGFPDILAWNPEDGRVAAVECKRHGQKPRPNQQKALRTLAACGVATFVCDQANEAEVMGALKIREPVAA